VFDWQRGVQVTLASSEMATRPRTKRGQKGGELAAEKENVDVSPVKGLVNNSNKLSLEEELEAMTKALKQVSLEKELNEAKLKEKDEQLSAQAAEAERIQALLKSSDEEKKRLEEKLRKLQKVQGFQPTLVCSISNFSCTTLFR
jgi:rubrerythrin